MVNPSDYAVKMINRGGDLEDRPHTIVDTEFRWHASQQLKRLPRTKQPNIQ